MNKRNQTLYGVLAMLCGVIILALPSLFNQDAMPTVIYIQILVCGLILARIADKMEA